MTRSDELIIINYDIISFFLGEGSFIKTPPLTRNNNLNIHLIGQSASISSKISLELQMTTLRPV